MSALQKNTLRQINAVHPTGPHSPGWIAAMHYYLPCKLHSAAGRVFYSLIFPVCRIALIFSHGRTRTTTDKQRQEVHR